MKHDYEAALRAIKGNCGVLLHMDDLETIEHALKLAAKVTGEPSEGMIKEGCRDGYDLEGKPLWKHSGYVQSRHKFINMIAQAEREIEG